jgi:hypothetical protein
VDQVTHRLAGEHVQPPGTHHDTAGLEDMVWLSRGPLAQVHELPL